MKVNLKKIGAIVAGATILASSAAFAGLMFGSTTLVDDNGAPVAKVVIGSNANPSDGVAGALIAGKMVSETYKSQTLTAQVSGTATCAAAEGNATGTCSITNEKARLEITVPGSFAAGTWTGNNLIGDFLNRQLDDRKDNIATDTTTAYPLTSSDTSESANPFTNGDGTGTALGSAPSDIFLYRISGDNFGTFANVQVTDATGGKNYVEKQSLWLKGDNHYDNDKKDVIGRLTLFAYTLKFDGPGSQQIGIPECTRQADLDYTACKAAIVPAGVSIDDATETHRVKVKFLGEDWIISFMEAPTGVVLTTDTTLVNGGTVKLAKESVAGILNQGESLPVDNLKFQLDDLEAHGDVTSAIISILDANGNVLQRDKVLPSETKEYNIGGTQYRFHVYKVAPGYTFGAKWADVAIFSKELELKDNQKLDQGTGTNNAYRVALGWKNLDAATGIPAHTNPDSLRTIIVYSDTISDLSSSGDEIMRVDDYLPLVQDPVNWKLTYKGLDLTSSDKSSLRFDLKTTDRTISPSSGPAIGPLGVRVKCAVFAPYVEVVSGTASGVFETAGGGSDQRFMVGVNDAFTPTLQTTTFGGVDPGSGARSAVCDTDGDGVYTVGLDTFYNVGVVFIKDSYSGSTYANPVVYPIVPPFATEVRYQEIGDGSSRFSPPDGGAITIEWGSMVDAGADQHIGDILYTAGFTSTGLGGVPLGQDPHNPAPLTTAPQVWFGIGEKAGTGASNAFVDYYMFGLKGTACIGAPTCTPTTTFDFNSVDSSGRSLTSDNDKQLYGHATPNPAGAAPFLGTYYCPSGSPLCAPGFGTKNGPVESGVILAETGYISERGSKYGSQSSTSVSYTMAHKLAHAQWFLAPASANASSASTTIATLGEGESTTVSGVTVKVLEITETVGACSAAGGAPACTADMAPVSAVITGPSLATPQASVAVAVPYTGSYGNVVILDSDAVGVNTLVSVGGDRVNTVTASLLQGSAVDWTAERKVVREVVQGSKIVVAGREAADTLEAAQDFVSQVRKV